MDTLQPHSHQVPEKNSWLLESAMSDDNWSSKSYADFTSRPDFPSRIGYSNTVSWWENHITHARDSAKSYVTGCEGPAYSYCRTQQLRSTTRVRSCPSVCSRGPWCCYIKGSRLYNEKTGIVKHPIRVQVCFEDVLSQIQNGL